MHQAPHRAAEVNVTSLLLDSNDAVQDPAVLASLRAYFGGDNVSITSLAQGDISITLPTGVLLIERKRPHDLLASIGDGRIFQQAQRMVGNARFAVILIQGSLSYNRDDYALADGRPTNWPGKGVRAALRAVQWAGCAVDSCAQGEFAKAIDELVSLASKPDHYHLPQDRSKAPSIDFFGGQSKEEMQRVALLASFPGIGPKRAQSLLRWIGAHYSYKGRFASTRAPDPIDPGFVDATQRGANPFGRICDALEWATMLGVFAKQDRPDGWGDGNIGKLRAALDLQPDEHLTVERLFRPESIQNLPIIEDPQDDALTTDSPSANISSTSDSTTAQQHQQGGDAAHESPSLSLSIQAEQEASSHERQHSASTTTAPAFGQRVPDAPRKTKKNQPKLF